MILAQFEDFLLNGKRCKDLEMRRLLMGKRAVAEVLKTDSKRLRVVYTHKRGEDPLLQALYKVRIRVVVVPKSKLSSLVQSESHQGFVAEVFERTFPTLNEFLSQIRRKSVVVMCDSIMDPHNFGAILRACECFGVDLLIFSKNRNVPLTPVVSKASVGGSELVPLISVSNLANVLRRFQDVGYFVVATENNAQSLYTFEFPEKTLLILGSENRGIQPLLSKKSDFRVTIPMHGRVDSLNVSQAAAIFLSHLRGSACD